MIKMSRKEKSNVEFKETDRWLNLTKSGKSVALEYKSMNLYAPVSQVKEVMNGKRDRVLLSELIDGEFLPTDVIIKRSASGKALKINDAGFPLISPVSQVNRLFDNEIEGVRLSLMKWDD